MHLRLALIALLPVLAKSDVLLPGYDVIISPAPANTIYAVTRATSNTTVSRVDPATEMVLWTRQVGMGRATASATGPDGGIFVTGNTNDPNFPITPGALGVTLAGSNDCGFVYELNPEGELIFSSCFLNGITPTSIAVNQSGEMAISFPNSINPPAATAGAVAYRTAVSGKILKLSPGARQVSWIVAGPTGLLQFDLDGNLVFVGVIPGPLPGDDLPISPGALQTTPRFSLCAATRPCPHQYIGRLTADGTRIVSLTYLSGRDGETPLNLLVTSDSIITVGSTFSRDYPLAARV